jgi:prephenate dehydrogenase
MQQLLVNHISKQGTDVQGGEYMTNDPQWYEAMAKAMKNREHALSMLERWGKRLNESEARVQELAARELTAELQEMETVSVPGE